MKRGRSEPRARKALFNLLTREIGVLKIKRLNCAITCNGLVECFYNEIYEK